MVPARAGMSPPATQDDNSLERGPRASGDEPVSRGIFSVGNGWSPRERG